MRNRITQQNLLKIRPLKNLYLAVRVLDEKLIVDS